MIMGHKGFRKGILKGFLGSRRDIWDLVSKVIRTLIGVISSYTIVALFITLITKSHDPPSMLYINPITVEGFPDR